MDNHDGPGAHLSDLLVARLSSFGRLRRNGGDVLTSTNLVAPVVWAPVATNAFDASGGFSFSSELDSGTPVLFYRMQLP
jgi:hypothetical protein